MLKVLIADDSTLAASLISRILGGDPAFDVVGIAKNGKEAVEMTTRLEPDVITMDIHMPVMNGFEATKEIMIQRPTPIVIVSASTSVRETEWAMQALRVGALDLLLKPPGPGSADHAEAAKELVDTVKSMAAVKVVRHARRQEPAPPATPVIQLARPAKVGYRAIAIAASTGGPPALQMLLGGLPADFPIPILLVQHIISSFVAGFAEWLDSNVPLTVKVAEDGERIRPGNVYVAPQEHHLGVQRTERLVLSDAAKIGGFRPSATFMFDSVANAFEEHAVAVILTGMGRDGVDGLRTVRAKSGLTIAQDEDSCIVFGMPGVAVEEGLADAVLPIHAIAPSLLQLVSHKHAS